MSESWFDLNHISMKSLSTKIFTGDVCYIKMNYFEDAKNFINKGKFKEFFMLHTVYKSFKIQHKNVFSDYP